jgi:hypothetical protein
MGFNINGAQYSWGLGAAKAAGMEAARLNKEQGASISVFKAVICGFFGCKSGALQNAMEKAGKAPNVDLGSVARSSGQVNREQMGNSPSPTDLQTPAQPPRQTVRRKPRKSVVPGDGIMADIERMNGLAKFNKGGGLSDGNYIILLEKLYMVA